MKKRSIKKLTTHINFHFKSILIGLTIVLQNTFLLSIDKKIQREEILLADEKISCFADGIYSNNKYDFNSTLEYIQE